ncbi:restriction endonuclease subunit S [Pseudomonas putida]|uniref:restriction endonuclease subunit S n=1 Tax=Pseudomonas putida TaxID=303 RepID=UPI00390634B9
MNPNNLESLTIHAIGGGWGQEAPDEESTQRVAVIRGTDIPKIISGDFSSVPFRYESPRKVASRLLKAGDLVIEVSGGSSANGQHTGRPLHITRKIIENLGGSVIPASFCRLLRLDSSKVDPSFIYYQISCMHLNKEISEFENQSTGISNFQFPRFLSEIQPKLKSLDKQREIANFLKSIDQCISLTYSTNRTLAAIAQTLFKSWFVDFDPVRRKTAGHLPEWLDEDTANLFPEEFEDSEHGIIPKGWERVPFGRFLSHIIGGDWGTETPDEKNDQQVAIIRGTDIPDLRYSTNNRVPTRYTSSKKLKSRRLQDGDIILEVSGGSKEQPTGRSIYITETLLKRFDSPVEPASFCKLLRPESIEISLLLGLHLEFIYSRGKTWEYQNQSTGISNFQTTHFLETELVVVPPDDVLAKFYEKVRPMIDCSHITSAQRLIEMRDNLLPKLISGEIGLPQATSISMKGELMGEG